MHLILFDTETTGLPRTREPATKGPNNWPHIVSLAWVVTDGTSILKQEYRLIKPDGWKIPPESTKIHGITHEYALEHGTDLRHALLDFIVEQGDMHVCHNAAFDSNVITNAMLWDLGLPFVGFSKLFCTMESSRAICKLPFTNGNRGYKSPKLMELYSFIMRRQPDKSSLHNSLYDTLLLAEIVKNSWVLREMIGLPAKNVPKSENDCSSVSGSVLSLSLT
jgi:DNA polymerase III subunit epsilon